jgi:cytochrome c oxidase subunit IV
VNEDKKAAAYRIGIQVFAGLMVLTVVEYILGIQDNPSTVILLIIALIKSALIVNFFMHVYRLWREEAH